MKNKHGLRNLERAFNTINFARTPDGGIVEIANELARSDLSKYNKGVDISVDNNTMIYTKKDVDEWCVEWLAKWYAFYDTIPDKENWGYHWHVPSEMHADAFIARCDREKCKYMIILWGNWTGSPFDHNNLKG